MNKKLKEEEELIDDWWESIISKMIQTRYWTQLRENSQVIRGPIQQNGIQTGVSEVRVQSGILSKTNWS